ncbi:unnamed protein product [Leptidea sinapis]|uniref:Splicing factor Cactin n=1 Tax=Leptidea sinapis TaxID=189913 RepID=A0A5E4QSR4_9NEOP|nr:unnamed protein product [Leptidea sinapis]
MSSKDVVRRERSRERNESQSGRYKSNASPKSKSKKSRHRSYSIEKQPKKHKKKKRKSSSSSSDSSSESDNEELKLLQRLQAEKMRLKEEKCKQKEQLKANETPEEKRARRLREKQEKERKRRERMGWDTEYQCYTNQDNPFGDSALTNTFVWTKKLAKEGVKSVSRDELEALNRQKQMENKIELEKVYKELETEEKQCYWEDVRTIVRAELGELRRRGEARARDGVHHAVAGHVQQVFKGKSGPQLEALQQQIEAKIGGQRAGVDVGYWESLLTQLRAHMSRARLRERHQDNLRRKLQLLKSEQGVRADGADTVVPEEDDRCKSPASVKRCESPQPEQEAPSDEDEGEVEGVEEGEAWALEGLVMPQGGGERRAASGTSGPAALEAAARRAMDAAGAGQEQGAGTPATFSVEHALPEQPYLWADKYRPRKPRYFNRVHTGFEWNKYNQTHYDMDNPPPKIKPCADNPEFAVLRFRAGPPYEDIAFKIVNREWEYSYKRGFRCHFHNNIFQLWFHFKRYRYRR